MHSISNDSLSIQIAEKGAELQSLFHRQHKLEYLWSGDAAVWGKKSPVLFPIVGELKNGSYLYGNNEYHLSRHGFARDMLFEVTEQTGTSITFSIHSNDQTLSVYPFQFIFSVRYTLSESTLHITYVVQNKGDKTMYLSVGGHPAFKVPLVEGTAYEDYQLEFEEKENIGRYLLSPAGLLETKTTPLLNVENVLPLKKELFSADAIVLKNLRSTAVSIISSKTNHGLKVTFKGFPYLGIWDAKGGDFVCIEPWCGIADNVNASGKLEEKEGINALQPEGKFEATFNINVF